MNARLEGVLIWLFQLTGTNNDPILIGKKKKSRETLDALQKGMPTFPGVGCYPKVSAAGTQMRLGK